MSRNSAKIPEQKASPGRQMTASRALLYLLSVDWPGLVPGKGKVMFKLDNPTIPQVSSGPRGVR